MVQDPANYRWSSYGEAVGGGKKGDGKKRRAKAWCERIFAIREWGLIPKNGRKFRACIGG
jgi:hypothetical protein